MNRLADETSPYLRQHAGNPVDWYAWGGEAFSRARSEDRPVFLSVGYSACHWCHVMAHESFEDQTTAELLNGFFVSVKVDREERPDVDAVYMEAVQALTGQGGWPMSVFLTPDGRPFYGGTYFPPQDRPGMPSFRTVLAALVDLWQHRRDEVEGQASELAQAIAARSVVARGDGAASLLSVMPGSGPSVVVTAARELAPRFDPVWGGFGAAPKFPQPDLLEVALRAAVHDGAPTGTDLPPRAGGLPGRAAGQGPGTPARAGSTSIEMAVRTLDAMAAGGIHDHLGGGFARYSTDAEWLVPHFEKMLYDQAGLLRAYLHGWQATGKPEYRWVMDRLVGYVQRDLAAPEGGLYSAEDADSEGVEGKFYVWTPSQVEDAVSQCGGSATVARAALEWFGVAEAGNFEGSTILRRPVGAPLAGPPEVEEARRLLLAARSARVRPGLDDKVLTEWNAMYAAALAEAAAATGEDAWRRQSEGIADFLWIHLRTDGGRWLRSWQRGAGARHLAYAGDYAWLVECATRLGELTGEARWTRRAVEVAEDLLALFRDPDAGGFFTTGNDAEALIVRTKDIFDGAMPAANAVAGLALARLGALTGEERYTTAATEVVELLGDLPVRHPTAFPHTLFVADLVAHGATEVVVTGDRPDLVDVVRSRWLPGAVLAWGEPTPSPLWEGREHGRAHVCRNFACRLPTGSPDDLAAQLDGPAQAPAEATR